MWGVKKELCEWGIMGGGVYIDMMGDRLCAEAWRTRDNDSQVR